MWWPSPSDYQDTVQNPRVAFSDPELRDGVFVTDTLGLPKPISGSFATVYQVDYQGHRHAVRCFLRHVPDIAQRYAAISSYLQQAGLPCMVEFRFLPQGIRLHGQWFPVVKMDWLDGDRLDVYIARHLYDPPALLELTRQFLQLAYALRQANIAHGDLQHGNLLVVNHCLRLLDYDGMFVPALAGRPSNELGQSNYQHPARTTRDYGPYLDNFSVWVITLSLLGLALDPRLRSHFASGGEALLLRHSDFVNPPASGTLAALQQSSDPTLRALTLAFLPTLFARDLTAVPPLEPNALGTVQPPVPVRSGLPDWLRDQLSTAPMAPSPRPPVPTAPNGTDWLLDHIAPAAPQRLSGSFYFEKSLLSLVVLAFLALVGVVWLGPVPPLVGLSLLPLLPLTALLSLSLGFSLRYNVPERRQALADVQRLQAARTESEAQIQELTGTRAQLDRAQQDEMANLVRQQSANAAQEKMALAALDQALQSELAKLDAQRKHLAQQETATLATALEKFQHEREDKLLEAFRISDAVLPMVITRELKKRLAEHGLLSAADITGFKIGIPGSGKSFYLVNRRGMAVHVEGISPERGVALVLWRRAMEARVKKLVPADLPADKAAALAKKFKDERVTLQLAELKKKQDAENSKARLTERARKEQERLTRAMQELPATYRRRFDAAEQELAEVHKALAEKEWALVLAQRRLQTYAHINFFNYLKSIFGL